jgi:hypothetical protein
MMLCESPEPIPQTDNYEFIQCWASGDLISPVSVTESQPVGIVRDKSCAGDCDIQVNLSGYSARPTVCEGGHYSKANTVVINPCPAHWPDHSLYSGYSGWWGYFVDDSNTKRLDAAIDKAQEYGGNRSKGVTMAGTSYGGGGVLMQNLVLDDITVVHSNVGYTLFVQDFLYTAELAWEGQDRDALDFRLNANPETFYRIHGSPVDTAVKFNLEIFDICNEQRLACFGTWHDQGHNIWLTGMPTHYFSTYPGPDSRVSPDKPLVAFSNSTGNVDGPVGHHNLGLEWNTAEMDGDTIPLRYRPKEGQPVDVTVDVTVRGVTVPESVATWAFGDQSGGVVVDNYTVTIQGLELSNSEMYTNLELQGIPGC